MTQDIYIVRITLTMLTSCFSIIKVRHTQYVSLIKTPDLENKNDFIERPYFFIFKSCFFGMFLNKIFFSNIKYSKFALRVDQSCSSKLSAIVSTIPPPTRKIFHIVISIIQDTDTEKNGKIRMISRNTYFMHRKKKEDEEEKKYE